LDEQSILGDLLEGGRVAKKLGNYEERDSQLALLSLIIKGFNEGAIVAAEAGTGVGKSFAYLLPAVRFVLSEKKRDARERVVISTATINLQQQLFEKDIPFVLSALGEKLRVVLVKGRGNYLCLRRLRDALSEESLVQSALFPEPEAHAAVPLQSDLPEAATATPPPGSGPDSGADSGVDSGADSGVEFCRRQNSRSKSAQRIYDDDRDFLRHIAEWSEVTKTGSKTELPYARLNLNKVWPRVCSESDSCMGKKCPERGRCFVQTLRREAMAADLLVVNHHLLFADLAARQDGDLNDGSFVLPPYSRVIIDEAHNIEGAATSFFTAQFSHLGLLRTIGQLYRKRAGLERGLLVRAAAVLNLNDTASCDAAAAATANVRNAAAEVSGAAVELCGGESAFRITGEKGVVVRARLLPPLVLLKNALLALTAVIAQVSKQLEARLEEAEDAPAPNSEVAALAWELLAYLRRVSEIANICSAYIDWENQTETVLWIEKRGKGASDSWAVLNVTPLEIASRLKNALWDKAETAILVSATLTVTQNFQYFFHQSGLDLCDGKTILHGTFPSPFPYQQAVLLAVPSDAPLPTDAAYRAFVDETVEKLCEVSGGRALALFTSYESMRSAFAYAEPLLTGLEITCYRQGDDDRARLLELFKAEKTSVLFATDSFWEGVDAPGETLSLLVIARLPFKMPGDPVFEARCEAVERSGGNAFMQLSVPEAVMKFRQGFGRLIRNTRDRGVVAVLDGRLLRKPYGRYFLQSLPQTKTCFAPSAAIIQSAETFFFPICHGGVTGGGVM
jgi:ATP-dependent DNA helicase DinG